MSGCWYCGTTEADAWERDHQLPITRGGIGDDLVRACRGCNRLKGRNTVEEFRRRLEAILKRPVIFAGEAGLGESHTCDMAAVRQVLVSQTVIRFRGLLAEEIKDAWYYLRTHGLPSITVLEIAERGVTLALAELAAAHHGGDPFPARPDHPSAQLALFEATVVTKATEATA
jgi:HNH endonuclease